MFLLAGFSTTAESQLRDILSVVGTALQRVRESHEKNAKRDTDRAHIIARRKEKNLAGGLTSGDAEIMTMSSSNNASILGSDEKGAHLPPLPISLVPAPAPVVSRRGVEEAIDDLPIVLIKNYQPQGAQQEDILNVLAEWAAKLVEDKVRLLCQ